MGRKKPPLDDWVLADEVVPRKVDWLWRERIPKGMISLVAGKPDQGKGLWAAHLSATVSKGGSNVIHSAAEDAHEIMTRPRLEAAGADLKRVFLWRFVLPADFDELHEKVLDNKVKLVVLDPFSAHLSGVSRHSDNIREVTNPLTALAEEANCAIVIIEHVLKHVPRGAHPLQAIGGSGSGLRAAIRMGFVCGLDPHDDENVVLCNVKHNICEQRDAIRFDLDREEFPFVGEIPSLVYQKECEFDGRRLVESLGEKGTPGRRPDRRAAAAEWVAKYLFKAGEPVKAATVFEDAKQYNLRSRTVRRAADDLEVLRKPPGGGRNCTWELPDKLRERMEADNGG